MTGDGWQVLQLITILDTLPPPEMHLVIGIDSVILGAELRAQFLLDHHHLRASCVTRAYQHAGGIGVDKQRWSRC